MTHAAETLMRALGMTLLDSLWQGALVLLVALLLLAMTGRASARLRYGVMLVALLALPVLSFISFQGHYRGLAATQPGTSENLVLTGVPSGFTPTEMEAEHLMGFWEQWAGEYALLAVWAWCIGLAVFGLRWLGGLTLLYRLRRRSTPVTDAFWTKRLLELNQSIGNGVKVALRESARITGPVVMGVIKPVIIFPIGLLQGLPTAEVEAILLHELAHIRRWDYLVNLLLSFLQVVYFYHPAYWWLQSQLDNEREFHCDEMVLQHGSNQLTLIKALASVKEYQQLRMTPSLAFAGRKNQLLLRVERIMQSHKKTNWLGGILSIALLLSSFLLMSYQQAPDSDQPVDVDELNLDKDYYEFWITQPDSDKVSKAMLEILEKPGSIQIETDEKGKVIMVKRDEKELKGAEAEVYAMAHYQLLEYARNRSNAEALLKREQELNELREQLLKTEKALSEKRRQYQQQDRELELSERAVVIELLERAATEQERVVRLPVYVREVREELSEREEEAQTVEEREAREIVLEEIREQYEEESEQRVKVLEKRAREMQEQYEVLVEELAELSEGKYDFELSEAAQLEAMRYWKKQQNAIEKPLIVVDGKMEFDWGMDDIDKIKKNRKIIEIDVRKKSSIKDARYLQRMKNRDVLVNITTEFGGEGYERPDFNSVIVKDMTELTEEEKQELFTKTFLDTIEEDDLAPDGWYNIDFSTEAFVIDGKKQPKKVLKRYLKLFEEVIGVPLEKGKTIELRD